MRRNFPLLLALSLSALPPPALPTSISEIKSGVPSQGSFLPGGGRQHLYFINVTGAADGSRLTVLLRPSQGSSQGRGFSLSVCPGRLPCTGAAPGCGCPRQWVDDGTGPGEAEVGERSVDVSPCDLREGLWYVAVDGWGEAATYLLTAVLDEARLVLGQSVEDIVCCLQSQFFFLDLDRWIKGNELIMKLFSDDRLRNQSPLRLSASYETCGDDDPSNRLAPSMGQVLTIPPEKVRLGRLYIGVHAIDGNDARFMLSVSYRPELKFTVIFFLLSMVVVVIATLSIVCLVRYRRRFRKYQDFKDQLKFRKMTLRASAGQGAHDDWGPDDRYLLSSDSDDDGQNHDRIPVVLQT